MPSSDPLSAPEQDAWLSLVAVLLRLPGVLDTQMQRVAGLTHFEYLVLAVLSETPKQTLRMSDLALTVNGSLSRLSHVVQRLEKRGWIRRAPCPTDGRYTEARLTAEGQAKVTTTAPSYVQAVRALVMDALTPDQRATLHEISTAILRRLDTTS
jgi:DNA-binding MarR family transcriptional regulator